MRQQKQVSTLLYFMVESAKDILHDLNQHLRRWPQTFRLWSPNLTAEFITSLYQLVENCDYSTMQDQMIWDHIVVGIREQALSQSCKWTLNWPSRRPNARQRTTADAGKHHIDFICRLHKQLQLEGQEISISFIQVLHCMTATFEIYETWWRPHPCHLCPAKDVQCHNCKHKGHFTVHCCSKSVAEVGNTPPLEQDYMILLISTLLAHN